MKKFSLFLIHFIHKAIIRYVNSFKFSMQHSAVNKEATMKARQYECFLKLTRFCRLGIVLSFTIAFANTSVFAQVRSSSDFNPRKPKAFIGGNIGFNSPIAGSDVYDMMTRELTLEKSDLRAFVFGGDLGITISSHFAVVTGFDFSRSKTKTESRDYVEDNGDPIEQTTQFSMLPITTTLRYYPVKTGEYVGSYAWIPTRVNPYIGGGGGVLYYDLNQTGRFVDKSNMNIFRTSMVSSGWTPTFHFAGGIDINLTTRVFINGEARYSRARADLSTDFAGFNPIDLSGVGILGGIYFRF